MKTEEPAPKPLTFDHVKAIMLQIFARPLRELELPLVPGGTIAVVVESRLVRVAIADGAISSITEASFDSLTEEEIRIFLRLYTQSTNWDNVTQFGYITDLADRHVQARAWIMAHLLFKKIADIPRNNLVYFMRVLEHTMVHSPASELLRGDTSTYDLEHSPRVSFVVCARTLLTAIKNGYYPWDMHTD